MARQVSISSQPNITQTPSKATQSQALATDMLVAPTHPHNNNNNNNNNNNTTNQTRTSRYGVTSPLPDGYFARRQPAPRVQSPARISERVSSMQAEPQQDPFTFRLLHPDPPLAESMEENSHLSKRVLRYEAQQGSNATPEKDLKRAGDVSKRVPVYGAQQAHRLLPVRSVPTMRASNLPLAVTRKERAKTDPVVSSRALREIIDIFDAHFATPNSCEARTKAVRRNSRRMGRAVSFDVSRARSSRAESAAHDAPREAPLEIVSVALTSPGTSASSGDCATSPVGKFKSLVPVRNFCHPTRDAGPSGARRTVESATHTTDRRRPRGVAPPRTPPNLQAVTWPASQDSPDSRSSQERSSQDLPSQDRPVHERHRSWSKVPRPSSSSSGSKLWRKVDQLKSSVSSYSAKNQDNGKVSPYSSVENLELPQALPSYTRKRASNISGETASSVPPALRVASPLPSPRSNINFARAVHHEARAQLLSTF